MLPPGPALKVTVHLNADVAAGNDFLHEEVMRFLLRRRVAGAAVLRIHAGFGTHHHLHTEGAPGVEGAHLPLRIEFIDTIEAVDALMPELLALVTDGMVEAHTVTVYKSVESRRPRA